MDMPGDTAAAAWALKAFALASVDSVPGRLIDPDVVDLPRWQAMPAPEECEPDSTAYGQQFGWPDLELARSLATPTPKARAPRETAVAQMVCRRVDPPQGIAS